VEWLELHVDFMAEASNRSELGKYGGEWSVQFPTGMTKLYGWGHDECCFHAYATWNYEWVVDDVRTMHKKGAGACEHISAGVDEHRGFGFPLSANEWRVTNEYRISHVGKKALPNSTPGIVKMRPGNSNDGWWGYDDFEEQVGTVGDAFNVCYRNFATLPTPDLEPGEPDTEWQLLLLTDWSQGHCKKPENGLDVEKFSRGYGGKQKSGIIKDTVMVEGCLGLHSPTLQLGETQTFRFGTDDGPPIADPNAPKEETRSTKKRDKHGNTTKITEGWANAPKGLEQILRERGLFVVGMTPDGNYTKNSKKIYKGDAKNMKLVLSKCPDFVAQKSKLQEFCDANDIIVDMSPKCHPEIAGLGIEYCWAVAKTLFRNENDFLHRTLSKRVQDALNAITLEVIWKCARRARDYMRGYRVLGGGELPKKEIEEQAKEQKRHRDVLNFSSAWIRSLLALYQPNAGAASTQ